MNKPWPDYELRGLIAREIGGYSVILPIWYDVDRAAVLAFSPSLADKVAIRTTNSSAQEIALQILSVIRPDIYADHPHAELKKLASGEAVRELQTELDRLRAELAEFRCPHCGSSLVETQQLPLDSEEKDWDTLRVFECGYTDLAGFMQRPCPTDPNFPTMDEYDIQCHEDPSQRPEYFRWTCNAFPKTVMARAVHLGSSYGPTEKEALRQLRDRYEQLVRPWMRPLGVTVSEL